MLYLHFAPFSLRKIQHAGIGQPITVVNSEFVSRTFGEASRSFLVSDVMMLPFKKKVGGEELKTKGGPRNVV